jgi:hypothetical protein
MTAAEFVQGHFKAVRRNGDGYMARCPAHDDQKPSLSVTDGHQGGVVLYCHAGCTTEAVCAALGLELRDLAPSRAESNGRRAEEARYRYVDADGRHVFDVVRRSGKRFHQEPASGKRGAGAMQGVERVLYRLPQVLAAAQAGEAVWIAEGEKDADALAKTGLIATCNPGGAGKWRSEYSESLRDANVVIVADRDEPGREHAKGVADQLDGVAESVCIVEPAEGKDAFDHLDAGRGLGEFQQVATSSRPRTTDPRPTARAEDEPLSIVTAEEFAAIDEAGAGALVGDADEALIPEDGDVMFYGDGGAGKTTLAIDLGCHLAGGDPWLGIPINQPRRVLLLENEGPRALYRRKLRRKLDGWAGSPLEGRVAVFEKPWASITFAVDTGRAAIAEAIRDRDIDVVIVGPVTRSGMNDAGTLQEVRDFMLLVAEVRRLAGRPVTFILIHHENKGGKVSGAWEGSGDTLFHVTGQGHGRTRLYVQKARWSSSHHATTLQLVWTAGEGFAVDEREQLDEDTLAEQIIAAIAKTPGTGWSRVEQATPGVRRDRRRSVRDALLAAGKVANIAKIDGVETWLDHCPERRPARLFAADDPTIQHLRPDPGADGAQSAPAEGAEDRSASAPCAPPLEGRRGVGADPHPENLFHEEEG